MLLTIAAAKSFAGLGAGKAVGFDKAAYVARAFKADTLIFLSPFPCFFHITVEFNL
jgi:hypothetical protein